MATLLLFCKRPQFGYGKQRLAAELGREAAFQISELLLNCAFEDCQNWGGPVVISPCSSENTEWAEEKCRELQLSNTMVIAQVEGNMGERIAVLDEELRDRGVQDIVIIGSDCPFNTEQHYSETVDLLKSNDIVLTPATDGGVTLMANRVPWIGLTDLPWSTENFGEALVNVSRENGLSVGLTEGSADIDTVEDLVTFYHATQDETRPARIALRNWIEKSIIPVHAEESVL